MAEYDKIDLTAKLAAYMRQFSDIPFADEVAEYVQASAAYEAMLQSTGLKPEQFTWYAPLFEARYKSIAEVLRKSGIRQVVELASGVSLRGLAMSQDPSLRYIDTDLPAITAEKAALVDVIRRTHGLESNPNYRSAPANAINLDEILEAAAGLDVTRPVAVVTEGLLMYLSPSELRTATGNVREVLRRFGGIWITPDFTIRPEEGSVSEQQQMVRRAVTGAIGRNMYESAFEDETGLQAFFDGTGFQPDVRSQVDEAPNVVSVARLNLRPDTLERLRPKLRLWVLHWTAVSCLPIPVS